MGTDPGTLTSVPQNDELSAFDTATGDLYYDSNGSTAGGAVKIAVLEGAPALTAADIIVLE